MSTTRSKIGGLLVKPALKDTLKTLLGLKGLVVKIHGSAKAKETKTAIFQCVTFKEQRINEKIVAHLAEEMAQAKEEKAGEQ